jgi:hypothetical protein
MFFHIEIEQNVDLEPMYFGANLKKTIGTKITEKASGAAAAAAAARGIDCVGGRRSAVAASPPQAGGSAPLEACCRGGDAHAAA